MSVTLPQSVLGILDDLAPIILKQQPAKTEGGVRYPAADFAFVPDREKPTTWKLRLSDGRPGNKTIRQLGRAAAALSPGGFRGRRAQLPANAVASVKRRIRSEYSKLDVSHEDMPPSVKEKGNFLIWKEKDGRYRWFAIFSNNYRDDDSPPEILAAGAHEDFVKAVDAGEWPYPELWHWHVPGSRWGVSDWLGFEGNFAMASGMVDKDCGAEAEAVAAMEDLGVSHGMPRKEIERSDEDPTVITRYRSIEISVLPSSAAANSLTGFSVLD